MAKKKKRKTATGKRSSGSVNVNVSTGRALARRRAGPVRRVKRKALRAYRRAKTSLAPTGKRTAVLKSALVSTAAAALMGYLQNRKDDKGKKLDIPKVDALGTCGTWGLGLMFAGYYTKNWILNAAAQGLLAVQAHEFGSQMADSSIKLTGDDYDESYVLGEGEI